MTYELIMHDPAEKTLEVIPDTLLDVVQEHLELLAKHPATLSRPGKMPYPSNCQMFSFNSDREYGTRWYFTILFTYDCNETHLHILGISAVCH